MSLTISSFAVQDIMLLLEEDNCAKCRMTLTCKHWLHVSTMAKDVNTSCYWDAGRIKCLESVSVYNFKLAHQVFSFSKNDIFKTVRGVKGDVCWWGLAIQNGDIDFLNFIFHEFQLTTEDARFQHNEAIWRAALSGNLAVLHFLRYTCLLTTDDARSNNNAAFRYAAKCGFSDILVHLHNDWGITTNDACDALDGEAVFFLDDATRAVVRMVYNFF